MEEKRRKRKEGRKGGDGKGLEGTESEGEEGKGPGSRGEAVRSGTGEGLGSMREVTLILSSMVRNSQRMLVGIEPWPLTHHLR